MERRLLDSYNQAVDKLKIIPKGSPRHIAASRRTVETFKALRRYRKGHKVSCARTGCRCLCDQCIRTRQQKPHARHCKTHAPGCHLNCGK